MLEFTGWRSFTVLLAMVLPATSVLAKDASPLQTGCTRTLSVAFSPLGRSMVIQADGTVSGTTRQVFDRLSKDTGCQFEYLVVPRARAFVMLKNGDVDLVPDATLTRDRAGGAHFVEAGQMVPAVISLARHAMQFASLDDMFTSQVSFVTINGHDYGEGFQAVLRNPKMQGRISTVTSPENAIKVLVSGRAQAILTGPVTIIDAWERFGGGEVLNIATVPGMPTIPFGLYLSKNMVQQDRETVENALLALLASGEIGRMSLFAFPEWFRSAFKPVISPAKPVSTGK